MYRIGQCLRLSGEGLNAPTTQWGEFRMHKQSASFRAALMGGAAAAVLVMSAGTAAAQERAAFNIAPQPLAEALKQFGYQSGHDVLASPNLAASKVSKGVAGEQDVEVALNQVLAGSGLTWRREGQTFLIVQEGGAPQSGSAAGGGATVEALIVTAQKREEDIQDVPIAISAFSQEDLTRSQVAGGPDLMTQVPNMTFTKTNFASYSIQLRGIGTQAISATTDPAVAVAFNNTPFTRNRFFEQEFYDLQRVEVLRGPQGTLYGRNATAGVVNVISQKPRFFYEAKLAGDVANYNTTRVEGMINIPLVEDAVALRLAGAWTKRDGYATNELTGSPIDGRDLWATRVSLRFSPNDRIDANLIWEHFEEDDDRLRSGKQLCKKHIVSDVGGLPVTYTGRFPGSQKTYYQSQLSQGCEAASLYSPDSFQTPNGFQFGFYHPIAAIGGPINPDMRGVDPYERLTQSRDLRVIESMVDPRYKAGNDAVQLQITFDLTDALSLTSETAWGLDKTWSTQDYNRFNTKSGVWEDSNDRPGVLNDGVFCDPQIGCSDRLVVIDLIDSEAQQFSQEFRLGSAFDGPFNFSLGANFLRQDSEDKYYVLSNAFTVWAASDFPSQIEIPYVPGVSDNTECLEPGFRPVSLDNYGGVSSGANCRYIDPNPLESLNDLSHTYFLSKNPYKLISYAVFGEAYYNIADNLKVTAGLRWTVDKKEAPRIPSWVLASEVGYPVAEVIEQEWREPTGRLTVDWKPALSFTDETLLYASYAHGYKAGGANPPVAGVALNAPAQLRTVAERKTFDAEFVDAFEVGSKNTLFDGRMTLNLGAFYYDYKDYQISQIIDRSALNSNFDADIWGLELEADWRPVENLRFGLKLGYENTRVADGEKAVDVMDRANGGKPDENGVSWIVVKPFPIYPSNCVVPVWLYTANGQAAFIDQLGNVAGSANGPCDEAYYRGLDLLTGEPYVPDPGTPGQSFWHNGGSGFFFPDYPGFDPASAPNNGEGFDKDLSGNELPNAPHYTATLSTDYTIPLAGDWLVTLHSDLYYQSEAWTRIFNMEGYDKLKAYTNVNLAAIFVNEPAGWNIMAFVKNVMDRDSITGAFLNSDDTGLTTNVFLTEPRLYGLRVTKQWTGGPLLGTFGERRDGPYPFTIEVAGQVQRRDAPYETVKPAFAADFPESIDTFDEAQHRDHDWGDGRDVKLTWRPDGSLWTVSLAGRYGRTNGATPLVHAEEQIDAGCPASPYLCEKYPIYIPTEYNSSDLIVSERDEHEFIDFEVGREINIGLGVESSISAGLRYAQFTSRTGVGLVAVPDWEIPDYWYYTGSATYTRLRADMKGIREFKGTGPFLSWAASVQLFGDEQAGHVDLDWAVTGGVLFGKQENALVGQLTAGYYVGAGDVLADRVGVAAPDIETQRSESATVPTFGASLGLSYEIQRVKVGAGYRWERYFDVLDAGNIEQKDYDRTIDGPYFKIAVGFGG